MIPVRTRTKSNLQTDRDEFALLMHRIILRFGELQERVSSDSAVLRAAWTDARGLAAWIEERLELLESRLAMLERFVGLPTDPAVAELRSVLANYGASLESLRVRVLPESIPGLAPAVGQGETTG